jgi:hypothetical protein
MKYPNGRHVAVGDRVELWKDRQGTVVCSIDTGEFTAEYSKSEWGYLGSGVVIRTDAGDVFHYAEPDEDFKLIKSSAAPRAHLKAGE